MATAPPDKIRVTKTIIIILAADKYLNRHNQVAAQLHLDICKHYAIKVDAQHWYQHNPEQVMENQKTTIL